MRRQPLGRSGDQAQLELILSKLTLTDHMLGVRAHLERLVDEHMRAVGAGQREVEGTVLDIVLVVAGLSEQGCEVAASSRTRRLRS